MKTIDIDKGLINYKKDILFYSDDNKLFFQSISNYINNEYLEIVYSQDLTLSIKDMLLQQESSVVINYIIRNIKTTIENTFSDKISNCDVTVINKGKTKTLNLELTLINDENVYNVDINLGNK